MVVKIDGNVIGSETPAAGTFTAVTVNDGLTLNAGLAINGDTTGEITSKRQGCWFTNS